MAISGVSTNSIFQSTINDMARTMGRLSDLQTQLSSGRKSDNFSGIAANAAQLLNLDTQLSKADQYITNNTLAIARLDTTNDSLNQIISVATSLKGLIANRRSGVTSVGFDIQLQAQWKALTAALNRTSNGSYVFSGTATDTPAVDSSTFPRLTSTGEVDSGYYQGSYQDIVHRAQDGVQFTANVRGNDPAFEAIFAGLATAQDAQITGDDAKFQAAYNSIEEGLQNVITIQATVNANKVNLSDTNTTLKSTKVYWQELRDEISNTDLLAVSTQVAVDQGILQAAFQAFAKINALKLSDYLR
ncbi:MAG: hypothetical protein SFT92_03690 [Rickettsiales bacterium]|nr:hypothetical protein [Rickettsiales bacterium]